MNASDAFVVAGIALITVSTAAVYLPLGGALLGIFALLIGLGLVGRGGKRR